MLFRSSKLSPHNHQHDVSATTPTLTTPRTPRLGRGSITMHQSQQGCKATAASTLRPPIPTPTEFTDSKSAANGHVITSGRRQRDRARGPGTVHAAVSVPNRGGCRPGRALHREYRDSTGPSTSDARQTNSELQRRSPANDRDAEIRQLALTMCHVITRDEDQT